MGGAAGRDTIHSEIFQSCFPSIRYVVLQQEVCLRLHTRRDATHAIPTDFQPERLGAVGEPLPDGDVFELGQTGLCAADRQCRLWCIEFVVVDRCVEIVEAAAAGIGLERRLEDDLPWTASTTGSNRGTSDLAVTSTTRTVPTARHKTEFVDADPRGIDGTA